MENQFTLLEYPLQHWLNFFAVAGLVVLIPGPDLAFVLGNTLAGGRARGFAALVGMVAGATAQVALTVVGVSALIAASPGVLNVVRLLGAAYLIWLGISSLRSSRSSFSSGTPSTDGGHIHTAIKGAAINLTNPKAILFYVSFLPMFVEPQAGPEAWQLAIHGVLIILMALTLYSGLIQFASYVKNNLIYNRTVYLYSSILLSLLFISLGIGLVFEEF